MLQVQPDTLTSVICVRPFLDIPQANFTHDGLYAAFARVAERMELKVGQVLWPPRIALTGKTKGPDIIASMILLGREETIKRLELAKLNLV